MSLDSNLVLIVDDEPDLLELLSFEFDYGGFQTVSAPNGRQALEIFKEKRPGAVVTDIRMPGGDGVGLLDSIWKTEGDKPIILFVTGFADITVEEAYNRGAEGIFAKPYDRKAIMSSVKHHLLKPANRWQTLPQGLTQPTVTLKRELPPIVGTAAGKELQLGRGGFFLAIPHEQLPETMAPVAFDLKFNGGPINSMQGVGITRWTRRGREEGLRGAGIEWVQLSASTQASLASPTENFTVRPFIPLGNFPQ